ncbi:hypothetical protein C8J56DRAFT_939029, partial [Mycena floridula]
MVLEPESLSVDVGRPDCREAHAGSAFSREIPDIPADIVEKVFSYLQRDPLTFLACSLVCRRWVPLARPYLFARLHLHEGNIKEMNDLLRSDFSTLHHHFHDLVFSDYDITNCYPGYLSRKHGMQYNVGNVEPWGTEFVTFLQLLKPRAKSESRVKSLDIRYNVNMLYSGTPRSIPLLPRAFPHISQLSLMITETSYDLTTLVNSFKKLESLELFTTHDLPKRCISRLPPHLERLSICTGDQLTRNGILRLLRIESAPRLVSLTFNAGKESSSSLNLYLCSPHAQNLRYLNIETGAIDTDLSMLPKLESLSLRSPSSRHLQTIRSTTSPDLRDLTLVIWTKNSSFTVAPISIHMQVGRLESMAPELETILTSTSDLLLSFRRLTVVFDVLYAVDSEVAKDVCARTRRAFPELHERNVLHLKV